MKTIKCFFGIHDEENIGIGFGGVLIQGQHFPTICRLWKCKRCGKETGQVKCPSIPDFLQSASPSYVKATSRFKMFDEGEKV